MTDEERTQIRIKMLRDSGFNADEARIIDDISQHAVVEAIKTLTRITDTAPSSEMAAVARVSAMQFMGMAVDAATTKIIKEVMDAEHRKA